MRRLLPLLGVLAGLLGSVAALGAQDIAAITAQPVVPAAGAQHADVVIVEYLDYNCPYCRRTAPELHKLLHMDPGVQILYKEWPIFGGASIYAARAALAANWQGKFLIAHDALIGTTHDLDQDSDVDAVLRSVGVDMKRLETDRKAHAAQIDALLARSERETHALGVQGTPVFLVGRQLVSSALTLAQLRVLVARSRNVTQ
ncbi:MAG: DsbA family protein [Steroidobacteraceae bacterium]